MSQPGQPAPAMRPMYPPPPGLISSQVPGQPIYGHPSQMQQAQMLQQQQQQQQQQFQYYMSRFPPHWQQEIHVEQSQERKKQLFSTYVRRFNTMQQQQQSKLVSNGQSAMIHQQIMGQTGMIIGPPSQRPSGPGLYSQQQQPGSILSSSTSQLSNTSNIATSASTSSVSQQQMRMSGHMASGQSTVAQQMNSTSVNSQSSVSLASGASPQVHSTFAGGHQMATGSPHMTSVGPSSGGMSNSPVTCIQPSTPQNPSSVQPGSVGPGSQQPASVSSQEENTKEYNDLVESLKEQYYEKLKRIGDRCDLDNSPKPTGFDRLMEILDRKRRVSQSLLEKIAGNVRTIVERSSLTFPVIETMRQIEAEGRSPIFITVEDSQGLTSQSTPQAVLDPWRSVRHMMIKVPEHLANLCNSEDDDLKDTGAVMSTIASSSLKRPPSSDFNDSGIDTKIEKIVVVMRMFSDESASLDKATDSSENESIRIKANFTVLPKAEFASEEGHVNHLVARCCLKPSRVPES
uniref:Mediator complex subunit 15 n=1 Tax=Angiostrongylus cantonensis TaxID=6313 RepID=A0A0K0D242_ANGCA